MTSIPPRLSAAFRAIADAVRGDGWRLVLDDGNEVQRCVARRAYFGVFRRMCDEGHVDAIRVYSPSVFGYEAEPTLDLDRFVTGCSAWLRARPWTSVAKIEIENTEIGNDWCVIHDPSFHTEADMEKAYQDGKAAGRHAAERDIQDRIDSEVKTIRERMELEKKTGRLEQVYELGNWNVTCSDGTTPARVDGYALDTSLPRIVTEETPEEQQRIIDAVKRRETTTTTVADLKPVYEATHTPTKLVSAKACSHPHTLPVLGCMKNVTMCAICGAELAREA